MGNESLAERLREQGTGAAREKSPGGLLYTLLLLLFSGKDGKSSKVSNIYVCVCICTDTYLVVDHTGEQQEVLQRWCGEAFGAEASNCLQWKSLIPS